MAVIKDATHTAIILKLLPSLKEIGSALPAQPRLGKLSVGLISQNKYMYNKKKCKDFDCIVNVMHDGMFNFHTVTQTI